MKIGKGIKGLGLFLGFSAVAFAGSEQIKYEMEFMNEFKYMNTNSAPMEEKLKNEKIAEYKRLFLEDKNLRLVFDEKALDKVINENVREVRDKANLPIRVAAKYDNYSNSIYLSKNIQDNNIDHQLFHELTHAVFNRGIGDTGFRTSPKYLYILKAMFIKGTALNEGATEYIAKKIVNKKEYLPETAYEDYVDLFQVLCMTYGEEFMFNAMKDGEQYLAEQLEKDGVSYNELIETSDESLNLEDRIYNIYKMMGIEENEKIKRNLQENLEVEVEKFKSLGQRNWNIVKDLFIKKYEQATPEEKYEIAKRVRDIEAGQEKKEIDLYRTGIVIDTYGKLKNAQSLDQIEEKMNIELYKMYKENHEIKGNIGETAAMAVDKAVDIVIRGAKHIPIDDIKEMKLEEVKNKSNNTHGYTLKSKDKIISFIGVYEELDENDHGEVYTRYGVSNCEIINYDDEKYNLKTVKSLEAKYQITEPINVIKDGNGQITYILNTAEGTKVFCENLEKSNELSEFNVEDKHRLGDIILEKPKKKELTTFQKLTSKISNILNIKQEEEKALPSGNIPFKVYVDVVEESSQFVEEPLESDSKNNIDTQSQKEFRENLKVNIEDLEVNQQNYQNVGNKQNIDKEER